jgi:hypothetical protein
VQSTLAHDAEYLPSELNMKEIVPSTLILNSSHFFQQ